MAGGDDGYKIERSLRFNSGDSPYTSRQCSYPTESGIWTLSCWVKRTKLGSDTTLFSARTGSNPIQIYFPSNDKLRFYDDGRDMYTDAVFRDLSAWYHIVVTRTRTVNSIYVNGVLSKSTTYSSSYNSNANTNAAFHSFGMLYFVGSGTGYHGNMYIAAPYFIDGQALAPTNFGETDDNGVWQPIEYSGTFGANGWHYKFDNNSTTSTLGTDSSGNGNNTSCNNISVAAGAGNDSLRDSPSQIANQSDSGAGGQVIGNYCTLNPLYGGLTLSNGNLYSTSPSGWQGSAGTIGMSSGKFYWEIDNVSGNELIVGIIKAGIPSITWNTTYGYGAETGGKYSPSASNVSYGSSWTTGDVIGIAFDADNGSLTFYKNGTSQGVAFTGLTSGPYLPSVVINGSSRSCSINFGQRAFTYTAPSSYKCLCTANLPDPTIADGSQYFDTHLYTGNSSASQALTLPFEPGMMWHKKRDSGSSHYIHDAIRGFANNKAVIPNRTNTEGYNSFYYSLSLSGTTLTAGDTNGGNEWNANNGTYVNWLWKGGSSTVTNTSGSITSQVRANTSAGFSTCTYTSPNSSSNQSFGHGLNAKPDLILVKNRDNTYNWDIYHSSLGYNSSLIFTSAGTRSAGFSAEPTSSVVNTQHDYTHVGTNKYVAFCWTAIEGYSAMGSYVGTNSTDGPFIFTGFRPAFVLLKCTSSSGTYWTISDNKRLGYNPDQDLLFPNSNDSENVTSYMDFVSNGFKLRINSSFANASGSTFVYAAFAEHPFKTARAR